MRHVEVKITSDDESDQSAVPIAILQDRGAGDVRVGGRDFVVNMDKAMVFDLAPGQKLDILNPAEEPAIDPEQYVAHSPSQQSEANREKGLVDKPKIPVAPNRSSPPAGTHEVRPKVEVAKTMTTQPTSTGGASPPDTQLAPSGAKPLPTQTPVPASTAGQTTGAGSDKK